MAIATKAIHQVRFMIIDSISSNSGKITRLSVARQKGITRFALAMSRAVLNRKRTVLNRSRTFDRTVTALAAGTWRPARGLRDATGWSLSKDPLAVPQVAAMGLAVLRLAPLSPPEPTPELLVASLLVASLLIADMRIAARLIAKPGCDTRPRNRSRDTSRNPSMIWNANGPSARRTGTGPIQLPS